MDDFSRIKCYHFGHSFVTRLSRTNESSGQSIFSYLGLSEPFNVVLQGFSGLTFDKVLSNPDRFLHQLQTQTNIDILSVVLGSNDLCHPMNTVSITIGKIREFLQLLRERGIQPKVIVFLSVLLRTAITRTGMADLPTFVHRARKFNRELSNEFRIITTKGKVSQIAPAALFCRRLLHISPQSYSVTPCDNEVLQSVAV